jgi:ubiquinone/menaquinone biosynthesis C-methylase UbiE
LSLLPDLRHRSREPELLDAGVGADETARSLADLRLVNRLLSGRGRLAAVVRPHLEGGGRLLDGGCGSGDVPDFLGEGLAPPPIAVGLDVKRSHLRDVPDSVRPVVADVRTLPFPDATFDVVTASLLLHHFDDEDLAPLLRGLYRVTAGALVVSDLHRSAVPHLFGQAAFPLLFQTPVSVHDGLVSIRRGFLPAELRRAFERAGIPQVQICRHFPYRLLAVATRRPAAEGLERRA